VREYRYLIVGGGMTADAACRGIREHDRQGTIGLVGAETHPPYARPPLSKGLWSGKAEDTVWRGTGELGVELVLGTRIASLDVETSSGVDADGETYRFEKVLLATGGTPRRLGSGGGEQVVYFRSLDDFRHLHGAAGDGVRCVVVGGGFIGSEIAAALSGAGCDVTMVFPEDGIGARLFPAGLSDFVNDYYRGKGVEVLAGQTVDAVESRSEDRHTVVTGSGRELEARVVVAGLGIEPDTVLAEAAGLEVRDGVVVDELGRVGGRDDVFAAGDVARFPVAVLGTDMRVEHEDHANSHGFAVGANMAGAGEPYDHLPFFYSDLFDLGYEAVGEVDSRLDIEAEWPEPNRKGVVCYVDDARRPRGFLLWDVWGKVDSARELIRAGAPLDGDALRALVG
jgi:3-phenylpropionate/trans-cinnamate dioxygenase ferredoxin reductase component